MRGFMRPAPSIFWLILGNAKLLSVSRQDLFPLLFDLLSSLFALRPFVFLGLKVSCLL
jgi:hypothetical protein